MAAAPLPPSPQHLIAIAVDNTGDDNAIPNHEKPIGRSSLGVDHEKAGGRSPNGVEPRPHPRTKGSSFGRTCLNLTNALSGMGVLSMPYALSEGGWMALVFLFIIAVICCYTGVLIQRCMEADSKIKSYPDIGEYAFGFKGKLFTVIFVYLELYLVAVSFLILEGDNLDKLFPHVSLEIGALRLKGKKLFVMLAALIILPTTWFKNLSMLAYVSACGLLASVLLLVCLLWTGIADTGFSQGGKLIDISGLPIALGLYFVCYTAHGVLPTVHTSMKNETLFSKVMLISYSLATVNYGVMSILGFLMYGEHAESQVTLNLPTGKVYSKIAIYTTVIIPLAKYALVAAPVAEAIEEYLGFQNKRIPSIMTRTLLLISTTIVALVVPLFGYVMSFTGSLFSVMISVFLPCAFYLKISKNLQRHKLEIVSIAGILLIGTIVAIVGTYASVRDIVRNL